MHWDVLNVSVHSVVSNSTVPWTAACQAFLSISNSRSLLRFMSVESVMPSNHLILSSPSAPAFNPSQHQGLFQRVNSSHQVAKVLEFHSTSVLPVNIQDWFPLGWTGWISFSPRDSQESSPTPQLKSINSSALSFLYSPTFTSIHDYWKNHSLD